MTIIRPVSDLRNNFNEISKICHKEGQPVYITKNGKGDLVVMSLAVYERKEALFDLYQKLSLAEWQSDMKESRISHKDMMKKLQGRSNE